MPTLHVARCHYFESNGSEEKAVIEREEIYPNKYLYFKLVLFVFAICGT